MNSSQWLVTLLCTAVITIMLGVGFKLGVKSLDGRVDSSVLVHGGGIMICALVILTWIVIVIFTDLYIQLKNTQKECKEAQTQMHSDIMKKYVECSQGNLPASPEKSG